MQKTALSLVALGCITCFPGAVASPAATVTGLQSSAWVQQENSKTALGSGNELKIGDFIVTDDTGRVEMQLWSSASLRLYPDSAISLLANDKTEAGTADRQPLLNVLAGRVCIDFKPQPNTGDMLELNIGNTIVSATHHHSYICLVREDAWSSIGLRDGSVQLTQSLDASMIILSKPGTEIRINDNGSYTLLNPGAAASIALQEDNPFITEAAAAAETALEITATVQEDSISDDEIATKQSVPAIEQNLSDYIYTVYLFSTGSEEVANEVNLRFQKAGHKSIIIAIGAEPTIRYRIAVSDFKSRQSAEDFASSVVGKLGISDTWIGKDRNSN